MANCRQHRERATSRLRAALEELAYQSEAPIRNKLLVDLARYAEEFSEDPEAQALVERCRKAGVIA